MKRKTTKQKSKLPVKINILSAILGDRMQDIEFVLIVGAPGSGGSSRLKALDLACFEGDNGGRVAPIICIDVSALADDHRSKGTALGRIFESMHDAVRKKGRMYLDWPVLYAIAEHIHNSHVGTGPIKVVIRGLPRTAVQSDVVIELIKLGFVVKVIEFDVNAALRKLNLTRRAEENRADDDPGTYANRVTTYEECMPFVRKIRNLLRKQGKEVWYQRHVASKEGTNIELDMTRIVDLLGLERDISAKLLARLWDPKTEAGKFFLPKHAQDQADKKPAAT